MFVNLRTALYQKGISLKKYAEFLAVTEKTAQNKLRGNTDFTYREFKKTCSLLLLEYNADYLFTENNSIINSTGDKIERRRNEQY